MLTFRNGDDTIGIRFIHKTFKPFEIEGLTGVSVGEDRRGSVSIIYLNSNEISRGVSICHPLDNFCRSTGRKKALVDALYSHGKIFRTLIWREYDDQMGLQDTLEYSIVSEGGHDYIIPSDKIEEWNKWVDSEEQKIPSWSKNITGAIVKFKDYRIE